MKKLIITIGFLASMMLGAGNIAKAVLINGGSGILDNAGAQLLETWLDEGDITLNNIYAKEPGDTGTQFHADVDGNGRSFTIIEIFNGPDAMIIGGYNPLSWNSSNSFNVTVNIEDRISFLFNLTTGNVYLQDLNSNRGQYQAYNRAGEGPAFGGAHDLYINKDLSGGYASIGYSYGDNSKFNTPAYITEFSGTYDSWTVDRLDVFAIVPEPAALILLTFGSLILRRQKR